MSLKRHNIFGPEPKEQRRSNLTGRYTHSWIENALHLGRTFGKQRALPKTAEHLGSSVGAKTMLWIHIIGIVLFLGLGTRLLYVQAVIGPENRQLAEGNRQRIVPIASERGQLLDRNGIPLTKNVPKFSLALVPQDLPRDTIEREEIVRELADLTSQEPSLVRDTLEEYGAYSYESIAVKEDLEYETALSIQIAGGDLPGIFIERGRKREYLLDPKDWKYPDDTPVYELEELSSVTSLSHILGYEGKLNREELDTLYDQGYLPSDFIGKTGIEKTYEQLLRGVYGRQRVEVDAGGRAQSVIAETEPTAGKHVRLTIDAQMQYELERLVKEQLALLGKERASAIVLDPNNGEILAMVSIPSFDNNDFSGGIAQEQYTAYIENDNQPLFHRAISGTYPSGSTIKPAVAAAALEEGIISRNTTFLSNGGIRVGQWFFPDWQAGGHGRSNVTYAIAWSVNTFFYYIGGGHNEFTGLGIEAMRGWLKQFGLGTILGIDIPGEREGFLPSKEWKEEAKGERWYIGDTYNASIGQGDVLVTPLQIAAMTSAIANGGTLYRPHLASAFIDPATESEDAVEPSIIRTGFISPTNINIIQEGMAECVEYGSCRSLSTLPFLSAGKTGTAQWSSLYDDHGWFTSFAPLDNPEIVITVLVEEGEGGSTAATPIARNFYRWWWNYTRG